MNQRAHANIGPRQTAQAPPPKLESGVRSPTRSRPPAAPDWRFADVSVYPPGHPSSGDGGGAASPDGAAPAAEAWQASSPLWYFNGETQAAPRA